MRYGKLVRDRIPEICRKRGAVPITRSLSEGEFLAELMKKLREEISEFAATGDLTELADLLEVIYALAALQGVTPEQLEEMRQKKGEERGGFADRVYLIEVK